MGNSIIPLTTRAYIWIVKILTGRHVVPELECGAAIQEVWQTDPGLVAIGARHVLQPCLVDEHLVYSQVGCTEKKSPGFQNQYL